MSRLMARCPWGFSFTPPTCINPSTHHGADKLTCRKKHGIINPLKIRNLSLFRKNTGWLDNPLTTARNYRKMMGGGETI